ncbi:hypothetical protein GGR88_000751 [Sphingomonas jejuensis]|uniref:Uncharacterized protein n=1 Tax=Sphingomonas jejuensis TaxID=904715 RepID=A0ABX0XK95_9SPHN|nr:hypothetical protein [Sphingomonas jejuensis]
MVNRSLQRGSGAGGASTAFMMERCLFMAAEQKGVQACA